MHWVELTERAACYVTGGLARYKAGDTVVMWEGICEKVYFKTVDSPIYSQ